MRNYAMERLVGFVLAMAIISLMFIAALV